MNIAILALQGAFAEHQQMLSRLGVETTLIRNLNDWNAYLSDTEDNSKKAIIIPGGESTAMLRIMNDEDLLLPIREAITSGMPVFGTCAGMILLAKNVEGEDRQRLATMDITVKRNAYGRQLGSFYAEHNFEGIGTVPMTFIRAPYISEAANGVSILSTLDGNIIAARQEKQLVCSFHPELNDDIRIHEYFVKEIIG